MIVVCVSGSSTLIEWDWKHTHHPVLLFLSIVNWQRHDITALAIEFWILIPKRHTVSLFYAANLAELL